MIYKNNITYMTDFIHDDIYVKIKKKIEIIKKHNLTNTSALIYDDI